jgi:hypothetical protein
MIRNRLASLPSLTQNGVAEVSSLLPLTRLMKTRKLRGLGLHMEPTARTRLAVMPVAPSKDWRTATDGRLLLAVHLPTGTARRKNAVKPPGLNPPKRPRRELPPAVPPDPTQQELGLRRGHLELALTGDHAAYRPGIYQTRSRTSQVAACRRRSCAALACALSRCSRSRVWLR